MVYVKYGVTKSGQIKPTSQCYNIRNNELRIPDVMCTWHIQLLAKTSLICFDAICLSVYSFRIRTTTIKWLLPGVNLLIVASTFLLRIIINNCCSTGNGEQLQFI